MGERGEVKAARKKNLPINDMNDTIVHDDVGGEKAGAIDKDAAVDRRDG